MTFLTESTDARGHRVFKLSTIALTYLKSWLIPDLAAIVPLHFFGYSQAEYYLRTVRVFRLSHALDITKESGLGIVLLFFARFRTLKDSKMANLDQRIIGKIIHLVALMALCSFLITCTWLWFSSTATPDHSSTSAAFHTGSASEVRILEKSWYYLVTTLTTIGYGDITPMNVYERIFVIFILFLGVGSTSFLVGEVNGLVTFYNGIAWGVDKRGELLNWLKETEQTKRLSFSLKSRIVQHFDNYFAKDKLKDLAIEWWTLKDDCTSLTIPTHPNLSVMSESLIKPLLDDLFSDIFYQYRAFFNVSSQLRYDLAYHFQPRCFLPGDMIISKGERPEELLFLTSGQVTCGVSMSGCYTPILYFTKRAIIGDYSALTYSASPVSFRAEEPTVSQCICIPAAPLTLILDGKYPHSKSKLLCGVFQRLKMLKDAVKSNAKVRAMHRLRSWESWEEECAMNIQTARWSCGEKYAKKVSGR